MNYAQIVGESKLAGIVRDTQSIGVNCFVQLASRLVVAGRNEVPLILGDAVDQRKSLSFVFVTAPYVPCIVGSDGKEEVSHGEIRIQGGGALKQRNSS